MTNKMQLEINPEAYFSFDRHRHYLDREIHIKVFLKEETFIYSTNATNDNFKIVSVFMADSSTIKVVTASGNIFRYCNVPISIHSRQIPNNLDIKKIKSIIETVTNVSYQSMFCEPVVTDGFNIILVWNVIDDYKLDELYKLKQAEILDRLKTEFKNDAITLKRVHYHQRMFKDVIGKDLRHTL